MVTLKTNEDVLNLLKLRYQFEDSDGVLLSYIEQAKERILGYTHLKRLPNQLFYEWAAIAYEFYKLDKPEANGMVRSISEGDTTIQFESSTAPKNQEEIIKLHYPTLRNYRVLP